jgi:hypothetical protein
MKGDTVTCVSTCTGVYSPRDQTEPSKSKRIETGWDLSDFFPIETLVFIAKRFLLMNLMVQLAMVSTNEYTPNKEKLWALVVA